MVHLGRQKIDRNGQLRQWASPKFNLDNVDHFESVEPDGDPPVIQESEEQRVEADFNVGVVPARAADGHGRKIDLIEQKMFEHFQNFQLIGKNIISIFQ